MEALGMIFPGAARISGARTTRPTLPSRRLVRPILEIVHRAAGLDLRAYHRGDGEHEDEEEDVDGLPGGIEGDGYWNISDDGSEWEDIGGGLEGEEVDEDEEDKDNGGGGGGGGAVLLRRGAVTSANSAAGHRRIRALEGVEADGWEVVDRIDGTSRPTNAAREASQVSVALGRGYQTKGSRQAKAKRPKYKENEETRYWTLSLARPHRTASTRKPDRKVNFEEEPDRLGGQRRQRNCIPVPLSASRKTRKLTEAVPGPGGSLADSSHEQPPASRPREQDDSEASSQDGVYLQAQQAAFDEFIRIAESADGTASSLVSVSTPTSRNLSSVLGPQDSFNSVDSGNRISLARMGGSHQQSDFKLEFIHHWLKAQGSGKHFRKRSRRVVFGWDGRRQDTVRIPSPESEIVERSGGNIAGSPSVVRNTLRP